MMKSRSGLPIRNHILCVIALIVDIGHETVINVITIFDSRPCHTLILSVLASVLFGMAVTGRLIITWDVGWKIG